MSEYWGKCVNCGRQIKLDGGDPDEKCYFCGKPALKKEGNMAAQIKAEELNPETREKLGITNQDIKSKKEEIIITKPRTPNNEIYTMPVPPRPDLTGLNLTERNKVMHKYYEANAPAILADRTNLGDKETRLRWGFSPCGYNNFLKRHGLTYQGKGTSKRREKKAVPVTQSKASNIVKDAPAPPPPPEVEKGNPGKPESEKKYRTFDRDFYKADEYIEYLQKKLAEKTQNYTLPPLPAFKWYWWPGVQKKWLEVYEKLAGK